MSKEKLTKEQTISLIRGFKGNINYSYISERWHKNPDVFKEALKKGMSLEDASEKLKDNESVVLEAIKHYPYELKYASERLKDDKKFVLKAIKQDISALIYVSDRLKNEKDVVLEAVKEDGWALHYASERLQSDKSFLEMLEKTNISNWIKEDKEWYVERMEVLANIREKELMDNYVNKNNIQSKKLKF